MICVDLSRIVDDSLYSISTTNPHKSYNSPQQIEQVDFEL